MGIESKVQAVVIGVLEVPESGYALDKRFIEDLGAASVHLAEIVSDIENEFGIRMDNADVRRLHTPGDVVALLRNKGIED